MIFNSTFDSSTDLGVVLLNGTADRVIENIFMGAHDYSIFLDREYGALIEYNEFNGQGHFLGSQAFDDGINRFIYNYWADFTTPDKNGDGIVDKPYPIDGPSFIFDPMPLTSISEIASIVSSSWTFPSTSNPITVVVVLNSSNLLNSITNTTSKGTSGLPGLTLPSLVVGFIALGIMIMIRRRKNN